tara:strand:+ start:5346 stop:5804 length:459 start_codon:yes stop_codon:yes gene_type:complete
MEKVNFKIDLDIVTHDKVNEHPFVNISLNGYPQFGEILDKSTVVEIDVEIEQDTENFLTIEYMNKDSKTDVIIGEDGLPIKDKRVAINGISVNDIDLELFVFEREDVLQYECIDPEGPDEKIFGFDATKLSWNGRTTLKFTTPIYIWILENI